MSQLSLAAVDAAAPPANVDLSQWFTQPELAARIVHWSGVTPDLRVLEPSAGIGRFVMPLARSGAVVEAIELDPRMAATCRADVDRAVEAGENLDVGVACADFLVVEPFDVHDLAVMNPPFEDGQAEAHVLRALQWAPRVVALLPTAFTGGQARYLDVWRHVRLQRLVHFTTRPSFGGDQSGSRDFSVFELTRRRAPRRPGEADMVSIEWWDP